jgi:hypothetical protein
MKIQEQQMSANNTSGTVLIRDNTQLPAGLAIESELYLPGWRVVRNLNGYELGRKIEQAQWNFFYLAGDFEAMTVGSEGPESVRRAVKHVLAKQAGQKVNSLQITKVVSRRFLGIPVLCITAHFRHIQRGIGLQDPANDLAWRISAVPGGDMLTKRDLALISSSSNL